MKIKTGRGYIPLITLIGIWSISALTSLPGLAVSPILGKLSSVFPHSTELDLQMLSSLPSLLIIPFIILSGKLTEKINTIYLLVIGLGIFSACGILYMLATEMWQLIAISALLGIGAGIIIPLSTGLISMFFTGTYRVKQFGLSSSISNLTLVLATALTGYLAEIKWNLPFVVYLLPIISIVLCLSIKKNLKNTSADDDTTIKAKQPATVQNVGKYGINIKYLLQLMGFYGLITLITVIISLNIPFLIKEYKLSSGISGIIISLYFLALMVPGLFLNQVINKFKRETAFYSVLAMAVGLACIVFFRSEIALGLGAILCGAGYGVLQPAMYEKTACIATPQRTTLALAFVMAMNYLAILVSPFVYDAYKLIFHIDTQAFPFIVNLIITIILLIFVFIKRKAFSLNFQS